MRLRKLYATLLCFMLLTGVSAQEANPLQTDIRAMGKETDPAQVVKMKDKIIRDHRLDTVKDRETIDLLHGQVAMAYVRKGAYPQFRKQISLIRNPFNQTSILNMAAMELLKAGDKDGYGLKLSEETIDRYTAFKDDPAARPAGFEAADWKRFMNFAQYPYYDTYAAALFAHKRYAEAIKFQRLAFDGPPEEAMPASAERYARLLGITGAHEAAEALLLKLAARGKLTRTMTQQLKSYYEKGHGGAAGFDTYMDSLQVGVRAQMVNHLRKQMGAQVAPSFTLKDLNGQTVSLSDFKGKVVILDLWATWCVPCIASFPAMQKLVEKHPDVVFLFIAVDEKGADPLTRVKNFMAKRQYPFRVLMDEPLEKDSEKHVITSAYRPEGIPAKYFIDKEGMLRFATKGFDTDAALVNEVDAIISILKGL